MLQRLLTLLVWLLVVASALAWGLRFQATPLPPQPQAQPVAEAAAPAGGAQAQARSQALAGALAQLLGAAAADAAASGQPGLDSANSGARFALQGVLAQAGGASGVALIAIDGKPARAYRLGASLDADWQLQALGPRSASLHGAQGALQLQMAAPRAALPSTAAAAAPAPVATLRQAEPGEMLAPGRRLRLHAAAEGSAAERSASEAP